MTSSRALGLSSVLSLALPAIALAQDSAGGAPVQEVVENPYGLAALWNAGDLIAHGTLIILLVMSAASWYVIVTKLVEQAVLARQAGAAERGFWRAATIRAGADALGRRSAFRGMVEEGLAALEPPGGLMGQVDREARITLAVQRALAVITERMQRGLAVLATVGSTAPFVGLFGTVWGIYHALTAIGIAGQASIDKVAGPVGEALIMTALGLAVAVPAVLGYNWLSRRNKAVLERVKAFSGDLHALLQSAGAATAEPARRRA